MKTRFNTYIKRTSFILFSLLMVTAMPAQAENQSAGAKCENGVVTARHYGPPGKGANWIPGRTRCEAADFAAMEVGVGGTEQKETHSSITRGVPGKPGYFWQPSGSSQ